MSHPAQDTDSAAQLPAQLTEQPTGPATGPKPRYRGVWVAFALSLLAIIFHAPILTWIVTPIVRSDPMNESAQLLVFTSHAQLSIPAYDLAAEFANRSSDRRVIVLQDYVRRAEAVGAEPSFVEMCVAQLRDRGVPAEQIQIVSVPDAITNHDRMRGLGKWLVAHAQSSGASSTSSSDSGAPSAISCVVVAHRLQGGTMKQAMRDTMPTQLADKVSLVTLPVVGIDEHSWYRSSMGIKWMLMNGIAFVHLQIFGEDPHEIDWSPDAYEAELRRMRSDG